jgi:ribosome-binding factor A
MARQQSTPETRGVRLLKVGEQVRHVIAELLTRQQVHDAVLAASAISVTEVRMSPDLRHATVFVRPLLGGSMDEVLKAMRTHTAYYQREVAQKLRLKHAAKLKFIEDESFDVAGKIDALLADPRVARDLGDGADD